MCHGVKFIEQHQHNFFRLFELQEVSTSKKFLFWCHEHASSFGPLFSFDTSEKKTIRKFSNFTFSILGFVCKLHPFRWSPKIFNLNFLFCCRRFLFSSLFICRWIPQQSGMRKWGHSTCMQSIFTHCHLQCQLWTHVIREHPMHTTARRQGRKWVFACQNHFCRTCLLKGFYSLNNNSQKKCFENKRKSSITSYHS